MKKEELEKRLMIAMEALSEIKDHCCYEYQHEDHRGDYNCSINCFLKLQELAQKVLRRIQQ